MKTFYGGEMLGEALPREQAPLYLHSLFVCHVFCLRVISFALMCNANASLCRELALKMLLYNHPE